LAHGEGGVSHPRPALILEIVRGKSHGDGPTFSKGRNQFENQKQFVLAGLAKNFSRVCIVAGTFGFKQLRTQIC
jgi:hypothetical protein